MTPICDNCARRQNMPAEGSQHYGICTVCHIRRACYDPDSRASRIMARRERAIVGDVPTVWSDREEQIVLSMRLRHDLRHLIAHGHCRLELSRRIYEGFKAAHNGKAPEDVEYTLKDYRRRGQKRSDAQRWFVAGERIGHGMLELTQWLDTSAGRVHLRGEELMALRVRELEDQEKRRARLKKGHTRLAYFNMVLADLTITP
jgi:hypothetical protein